EAAAMRDEHGKIVPDRDAGTSGVSGPPSDDDNPAGPYEKEALEAGQPTASGASTDDGRRDTETPMGLIGSGKPPETSGSGLERRPVEIRTDAAPESRTQPEGEERRPDEEEDRPPGETPRPGGPAATRRRSASSRSGDRRRGRSGGRSPEARG
ncbi:MAG TPA: hypothetical protein VHF22_11405, partial [Planctomycetota bacterium]|nr:hypothetical protein [Planctomycetota bacterium]